jgi:hypothetical protein
MHATVQRVRKRFFTGMSSSDDESSDGRVFVLEGHLPFEVEKIKQLLGRNVTEVNLGPKFIAMDRITSLLIATKGSLRKLTIPDLSFLGGRDSDAYCTTPPLRELYMNIASLSINCSFQPKALKQMQTLTDFIAGAEGLEVLVVTIAEYPTDKFLDDEKYRLPDYTAFNEGLRAQAVRLPTMLHLPTPEEKRQELLDADGRQWGRAFAELMTGRQLPEPKINLLEAAIQSITSRTNSLNIANGEGQPSTILTDLAILVPRPPPQQQLLSPAEVRAKAGAVMRQLDAKPKHEFMTALQWREALTSFLSNPLPPQLAKLSLQVLFPPPPIKIRVLSGLRNLETLRLLYCDITDATLEALMPDLTHMPQLRVLDLERNHITSHADLGPIAECMPSLEELVLKYNDEAGGPAFTSLFRGLAESGNTTLRKVNLSYNNFNLGGVFFRYISGWMTERAVLILPNVFSRDIITKLESLMPDGSTLCFEGNVASDGRAAETMLSLMDGAME